MPRRIRYSATQQNITGEFLILSDHRPSLLRHPRCLISPRALSLFPSFLSYTLTRSLPSSAFSSRFSSPFSSLVYSLSLEYDFLPLLLCTRGTRVNIDSYGPSPPSLPIPLSPSLMQALMTCLFCCAHHRRRAPNNKREQQPLPHKPDPKVIRLSEVHNGGTGGAQQAHVFASCFSSVIVVGWPPLFMTFPSLGSRRSKWFYYYCSKGAKGKAISVEF